MNLDVTVTVFSSVRNKLLSDPRERAADDEPRTAGITTCKQICQ